MGTSAEAFFSQAPEGEGQPQPEPQVPVAQTKLSAEDFFSGKTPGKQMFEDLGIDKPAPSGFIEKGLSAMKSAGGNAAILADMVLSFPMFAVSLGANVGSEATGVMLGQDRKEAAQGGRQLQEKIMHDWSNPLHQLMRIIDNGFGTQTAGGYSDNTAAELFGKISSLTGQAGEWVEKKTDGAVKSEEVETMVDGLMLLAGTKGGDMVKKLWEQRKKFKEANPDYIPPEVPMEQTQEQGPRATAQQDINEMLNIRSTRDRRAYEQKRRREVREAFNQDPDYADYLKFAADERVSNHDNWTKAAREQEQREQRARESDDPNVPKPAEPTTQQIFDILGKPGTERTSADLIALRRFNQSGSVRPELLARMAAAGMGAAAGLWLDPEDPMQAMLLGGAAAVAPTLLMGGPGRVPSRFKMAGAVKGPGGMWHPEAVTRLSEPLMDSLGRDHFRAEADIPESAPERAVAKRNADIVSSWSDKAIRNYLNKYAGTERDPLKDVVLPSGKRWEEVADRVIQGTPSEIFKGVEDVPEDIQRAKPGEKIFEIRSSGDFGRPAGELTSYLSHVGDYLRQNVKPEELQRYDLVRAVRETAANDARMAKEMEKAQAASTKDLPVYKEYPDGMRWVELKLPEKLTPEQMKTVRKSSKAEIERASMEDSPDAPTADAEGYTALDAQGKPIKNNYTSELSIAPTPEEAWLAGRLAEEGNSMGHCVGGYCAGVASGESRIFSLRDKKGGSHVTVEVEPHDVKRFGEEYFYQGMASEFIKDKYPQPEHYYDKFESTEQARENAAWRKNIRESAEYKKAQQESPDNISQIKGKQNRAPVAEYLPYVQDFVKGGKWGEVGDFEHTGLWKNSKGQMFTDVELLKRLDTMHRESNGRFPQITPKDLADYKNNGRPGYTSKESANSGGFTDPIHEALELGVKPSWEAGARGRQEGSIDVKTAAKLAGLAGGVVAGASMADNKVMGAILGGLGGLMVGGASPRGVASVFRKVWAPDNRIRVEDILKQHDYKIQATARVAMQLQNRMENLTPKVDKRNDISHAIEANDLSKLTPQQRETARVAQDGFAQLADVAREAGVLHDAISNYVTHLWKPENARAMLGEIFGGRRGASMSPETRFALKRSVPTLSEGKAKGLMPISEDISTIFGIYANAIGRAMANKELITALRNEKVPGTDQGLVLKHRDAPASYVRIDHPQLADVRVHPDIAPSLRFVFDNYNPGVAMRGIEGINMLSKRMEVSFSFFHDKALTDAYIGGKGITTHGIGSLIPDVPGAIAGVTRAFIPKAFGGDKYLQQLREGGAGDLVDSALKGGLKFQMGREGAGVEDVTRGSFYSMLRDLQAGLDNTAKGAGLPVKGFIKLSHYSDKVMWERLHPGSKLGVAVDAFVKLSENNAKAHAKNPQVPLLPKEKLWEYAASYANDIFGGLNWRAIAESVGTVWGRDVALAMLSPVGRRIGQLILFAPDWTLSTTRAAVKAFGVSPTEYVKARAAGATRGQAVDKMLTGSGPGGLLNPQTLTDLHRQYLVRSAIYYLAVGDALNYAMSGHHLWDNKDSTTIDMGDGRTMQWSKHTMEPVHWLTKPRQQLLNKLGFFPREIASQALGVDYLSAYGKAPPMGNRIAHALKSFMPISTTQGFATGSGKGIAGYLSSALGTPIYGKTYAERQAAKEARRLNQRTKLRDSK